MNPNQTGSFTRILAALFAIMGSALAQETAPKDLQIYLLIGDANMGGRAEIPADAAGILQRCYLLNDQNEWEPAMNPLNRHSKVGVDAAVQKLGPGYGFAKKMLDRDPNANIGLIVNASDASKMADWLGKSELYWSARKRVKTAVSSGVLKGVLWQQRESGKPEEYPDQIKTFVSSLRADVNVPSLPFIVGQLHDGKSWNDTFAKLPESIHLSAYVPVNGLGVADNGYFDSKSQIVLGERFAEQMIVLSKTIPEVKPPADIRFIDPHVHAMSVTPLGLRSVAQWMDERNVEHCIVSPLDHKGSRPQNEEERKIMLENFKPYKGKIHRMTIINSGEMETADQAVAFLKKEMSDGAVGFGEHYGVGLMFDDPKNLMLYEACEKVGLPVMFHIDQNKNMVEPGMERVDKVLKQFPKCTLVAHAYWWRQLGNGTCDRQLQEHPNLYADMSGHVVISVLNRDRKYAREFLIRNQDKILWATDEGWWSFGKKESQMNQHYTFLEELDLPDEVRQKIYRGNAEKVYGLKKDAK